MRAGTALTRNIGIRYRSSLDNLFTLADHVRYNRASKNETVKGVRMKKTLMKWTLTAAIFFFGLGTELKFESVFADSSAITNLDQLRGVFETGC